MKKLHAMWIHGTAIQPRDEGYFLNKQRNKTSLFSTTGSVWFHVPIPTPVYVDNEPTELAKVFVLYKTTKTAKIEKVHIRDNTELIAQIDGLNLSGDHSTKIDDHNVWNLNPIHLKYGLQVSLKVNFGDSDKSGVPSIEFASAGADFFTDD